MFTRRGFMAAAAGAAALPGLPAIAASPAGPPHRHDLGGPSHHSRHSQQRRRRVPLSRLPRLRRDGELGLHPYRRTRRCDAGTVHRVAHRRGQSEPLDLHRARGCEVPRRLGHDRERRDLELPPRLRRQVAAVRCARRTDRARHAVDDRHVREGRRQDHRADDEVPVQLPALSAAASADRQPDAVGEGRQDLGGIRQAALRHRPVQDHQGGARPVRRDVAQRGILGQDAHPEARQDGGLSDGGIDHAGRRAALRPGGLDRGAAAGFNSRR